MSINNWYGISGAIDAANRAARTWGLILRDPTSVVIDRDGANLPAQTVKLTRDDGAIKWVGGDSAVGKSAKRDMVIFGIKDHSVETDTDLKTGDRFAIGKTRYEISDVVEVPGGIQAGAQQMQG